MKLHSPPLERKPHLALQRRLKDAGFSRANGYYIAENKSDLRMRLLVAPLSKGRAYDLFIGYVVPSVNLAIKELRDQFPIVGKQWSRATPALTSNKLRGLLGGDPNRIWRLPPLGEDTIEQISDDIEAGCRKLADLAPTHDAIRDGILENRLHGEGGSEFNVPMFMARRRNLEGFAFIADRILAIPQYNQPDVRNYLSYLNATYLDNAYQFGSQR